MSIPEKPPTLVKCRKCLRELCDNPQYMFACYMQECPQAPGTKPPRRINDGTYPAATDCLNVPAWRAGAPEPVAGPSHDYIQGYHAGREFGTDEGTHTFTEPEAPNAPQVVSRTSMPGFKAGFKAGFDVGWEKAVQYLENQEHSVS